jgi:O-succinylbenzoate synthase
MRVTVVELRRVGLPLVAPFRTAHGTVTVRDVLLVHALGDDGEGWGECGALPEPTYSEEYVDGAAQVIRAQLAPRLLAAGEVGAADVAGVLGPVVGHRMAKAALEMAVLDADLRAAGRSLADHLGGVRAQVEVGVSVGIHDSVPDLLAEVDRHLADGYRRVKLKIAPGWDVEPVRAVRAHVGDEAVLQVDANGAYTLDDADHLAALDACGLALIEQPLPADALLAHAELARRLRTPVGLDETVTSAAVAADAIALGAAGAVSVKAARVGGLIEARRVHDVCVAGGVPALCGGLLETGLGKTANLALASLPGFTLPGDLSPSHRWYACDVTAPLEMHDGLMAVPTGPGLGVAPDPDALDELTVDTEWLKP